jgi:hypothetical protein
MHGDRVNKLSVRGSGVAIGRKVDDNGSKQDREAGHLLVLIHGFNNSEDDADDSYTNLRTHLAKAANGHRERIGSVWEFYWPGDPTTPFGYSGRNYSAMIAGDTLAQDWVARLRRDQTVSIVAHSLGCRVAMETIRSIRETPNWGGARIGFAFLMAAAVPEPLCEPSSEYYPDMVAREHVFYSRSDWVLWLWFRPGQRGVTEPGRAVGRYGGPPQRWSTSTPTGLGHGEYWASADVAGDIAYHLGARTSRGITSLMTPLKRLGRRTRPIRHLAGRALPRRGA